MIMTQSIRENLPRTEEIESPEQKKVRLSIRGQSVLTLFSFENLILFISLLSKTLVIFKGFTPGLPLSKLLYFPEITN